MDSRENQWRFRHSAHNGSTTDVAYNSHKHSLHDSQATRERIKSQNCVGEERGMRTIKIHDNVYRVTLYFIVGSERDKCKAWLVKNFGDVSDLNFNEPVGAKTMWHEDNHKKVAIWLSDSKNLGYLVHELTHIVHRILSYRGLKLTDETEEAYAYYTEFWFNSCKQIL